MALIFLAPIGLLGLGARYLLNKKIEKKVIQTITEARLQATDEATKSGLQVIREKLQDFLAEKFAEGIIIFIPIGMMFMDWITEKTAGYIALGIFLLLLLSKLQQKVETIKVVTAIVKIEGFSPKKIVASFIYKRVFDEVAKRVLGETSKIVPRLAIFFSKYSRNDLSEHIAHEVAHVAAHVSSSRIIIGSISTVIGSLCGLIIYIMFYQTMIAPYIMQNFQ